MAISAMARESSIVFAPSSRPGKMWQCRSTIEFLNSLLRPSRHRLPYAQRKEYRGKYAPQSQRLDLIHQMSAKYPAKEHTRNKERPRLPVDVTRASIHQK